jgi:hypothetical protein
VKGPLHPDRGKENPAAVIRQRELAKVRKRRHRKREKNHELVLAVPLRDDFVTWALERGYVDERQAWDRKTLARIARRIIETAMGSTMLVTRPSVIGNDRSKHGCIDHCAD